MKKNKNLIYTVSLLIGAFLFCMSMNLTGSVLSDIMTDYHMNLDHGGLMSLAQYLGGVAAILFLSVIADRMKKPVLLIISFALVAVMLFGIGTFPPFALFMILYLVMGAGLGMLDSLNNAVINDLYTENRNMILSILHAVTSIGAAFIPILTVIVGTGNWKLTYRIVALVVALIAVLQTVMYLRGKKDIDAAAEAAKKLGEAQKRAGRLPVGDGEGSKSRPDGKAAGGGSLQGGSGTRHPSRSGGFFRDGNVWTAALAMFFFGVCQSGVTIWCVKYCREVFPQAGSLAWSVSLSVYWLGAMICRLSLGLVPKLRNIDSRKLIIYGGITAGAALLIGVLSGSYAGLIIGILIMGILNGGTLPRIVGIMADWYPDQSGLTAGVSFISLYLAFAFIPLLMGVVGAHAGMQAMMLIPAAGTVISGILGLKLPKS